MKQGMGIVLIVLLVGGAAYGLYMVTGKGIESSDTSKAEVSEAIHCAPTMEGNALIESGIYVGTTADGYEIAPGEDGDYDLSEKVPNRDSYHLTCYYGAENYIQVELPESVTTCAFKEALLVCV